MQRPARYRASVRRRPQQSGRAQDVGSRERTEVRAGKAALGTNALHRPVATVTSNSTGHCGVLRHPHTGTESVPGGNATTHRNLHLDRRAPRRLARPPPRPSAPTDRNARGSPGTSRHTGRVAATAATGRRTLRPRSALPAAAAHSAGNRTPLTVENSPRTVTAAPDHAATQHPERLAKRRSPCCTPRRPA